MVYRPLGDSGLMVSAVGIGCNAFGRRVDADGRDATSWRRGARRRGHAARHRRRLRRPARRQRGAARRGAAGPARRVRRGHQVRHGHARRQRPRPRGARVAPLRPPRRRGAACAGCRPTTSTSTSCTCPTTSRRSRRRCRRSTDLVHEGKVRYIGCSNFGGWQVADADWTARSAGLERFVVACRTGTPCSTAPSRTRSSRRASTFGLGRAAVLPAGVRPAHRQVPARRDAPRPARAPTVDPSRAQWLKTPTGTASRRSRRTPRRAACRSSTSPIAGLAAQPAVGVGDRRRHLGRAGAAPTPRRCAGSRPRTTWSSWTSSLHADEGRASLRARA